MFAIKNKKKKKEEYLLFIHLTGFKFNFFDSLLKLARSIIFYLLNLSANLLFHTYKYC